MDAVIKGTATLLSVPLFILAYAILLLCVLLTVSGLLVVALIFAIGAQIHYVARMLNK